MNSLSKDDILTLLKWLKTEIEAKNFSQLNILPDINFYHDINSDDLFDMGKTPSHSIGSLSDDIDFLRTDLQSGQLSTPYNLIHFMMILRLLIQDRDDFFE